ncbi:TonB-dependent siderophore receptor [Lysobacter enzymogenes]|uniref:TonB-dependent siderophore receptor n=1 Tax=Lysobacter enzymogenes TaxID=69 RepID=UPI001AFCB982|nr:TonB-dependent siderophore receptor [Lysobacter enzymogenes]QQQ02791.1 TonB-dependent siderophore receptor [Lysobacter enzymogenes]
MRLSLSHPFAATIPVAPKARARARLAANTRRGSALALALSTALAPGLRARAAEAEVAPAADAATGTAVTLDEVVVRGQRRREAGAALKLDAPALETPQAVSTVTRETLDAQGARRLGEALRNVAGVTSNDVYGFFDGFNIRGFNASADATYLDGLLWSNSMATTELSGLDRVEVVKGPASGLYGQGPLSGLVNLVSKRPQEQRFVTLDLAAGSYGLREVGIDANSPLDRDGRVLARLNAVYRDQDFFVDFSGAQRKYLAPSLTWNIGEATSITVLGTWQRDRINPWSPIPAYGSALANPHGRLPRHLAINERDAPAEQNRDYDALGYSFEHRFSERLVLRQSVRYSEFHDRWDHWLFVAGVSPDLRTFGRFYYGPYEERGHDLRSDTSLSWTMSTGAVEHRWLLGYDYSERRSSYTNTFDPGPYDLDVFAPVYGRSGLRPAFVDDTRYDQAARQRGIYLQDHAKIGERTTLTLGGRWDVASSGVGAGRVEDRQFSPRAGLTYALRPELAVYLNHSRSFAPQGSYRSFDGSALPPERGVNNEIGLKLAPHDGRIVAMLSMFELTRQDMASEDPQHPNFYVTRGEQRSRGLELEGQWRPRADWELSFAYAWTQAEIVRDQALPAGARLAGVPRHSANLWARYTVPAGPLSGLGIALGAHAESERLANNYEPLDPVYQRPFRLKGYTTVDAALSYEAARWDARLNFKNLFDKRYIPGGASSDRTAFGEPRTVVASVQWKF